jgi:hypothetical protein
MKKIPVLLLVLGTLALGSLPAWADVVKSCNGVMEVWLSYQPKGEENVIRKTGRVRVSELMVREGRYGGRNTAVGRQKARRRACKAVVKDMARAFSNNARAQFGAICGGRVSYDNPGRDSKFFNSDWIKIDKAEVRGFTDSLTVKYRADIKPAKERFRCKDGTAEPLAATETPPARPGGVAAPPPTLRGGRVSPNTDRPGQHYRMASYENGGHARCQRYCEDDARCKSWVYSRPGTHGIRPRCYLKSNVPPVKPDTCCVSGVKAPN